MARAKPRWRRLLTGRYLRWLALRLAVALVPALRDRLFFYPDAVDLPTGADAVLESGLRLLDPPVSAGEAAFLARCALHDSVAAGFVAGETPATGRQTVLLRGVVIDPETGLIVRPDRGVSVLVRGERVNWNLVRPRWNPPRQRGAGVATLLVPTGNHYHMLVDAGLSLVALAARPEAAGGLVALTEPPRSPAQALLHAAVGRLDGVEVRSIPHGTVAVAETALVGFACPRNYEWPPVERSDADRLAALLRAAAPAFGRACGPLLFLDRGSAKLRRMANAAAVGSLLDTVGFERFVATADNLPEQVARFAAARVVVAVHGAGLANLLFCRPGCRVIEIFPGNFIKSTYWWMARRLGLRYTPVIGGPGDYDQRFTVSTDALARALDAD